MITGMLVILVIAVVAFGSIIALNWTPDRPLSTLTARWAPPPSIFLPLLGVQVHLRDQGLSILLTLEYHDRDSLAVGVIMAPDARNEARSLRDHWHNHPVQLLFSFI